MWITALRFSAMTEIAAMLICTRPFTKGERRKTKKQEDTNTSVSLFTKAKKEKKSPAFFSYVCNLSYTKV